MALLFSFCLDFLIISFIIFLLTLLWMQRRYTYWKRRGIEGPEPSLFFGNVKDIVTLKKSIGGVLKEIYDTHKSSPYIGIYMMFKPTMIINDLDLIKLILVKDFNHFSDRQFELNPKYDPLTENLFHTVGEKWKTMRQKLRPTFTSNKMRFMFQTLKDCVSDLEKHLDKVTAQDDEIVVRDALTFFGINVIGSCAFGVDCNTFLYPDSALGRFGKKLFLKNKTSIIARIVMRFCFPSIIKNLKFSIIGKETNDMIYNLVDETIKFRNNNNVKRDDFLQLLMQMHDPEDRYDKGRRFVDDGSKFTTMQIAAQAFVFFIAGFDSSSNMATFTLYELAMNPKIQNNVREDINSVLKKYDGNITYEGLKEMTYLNKAVEETLRKYTPSPFLIRKCTKEYRIPDTNHVIEKGTAVMISLLGIQRDPEYFPDPERFDPERFSPENKDARHQFTYLPFGEGPRVCIAKRFGLMQIKLAIVSVLSNYEVFPSEKTSTPVEFDLVSHLLTTKDPIYLKLKKISR